MNALFILSLFLFFFFLQSNAFIAITKSELRGLYANEALRIRNQIINATVSAIYTDVIKKSQSGIYEFKFNILCSEKTPHPVEKTIAKYNINFEELIDDITGELRDIFPDIYIHEKVINYCAVYEMTW